MPIFGSILPISLQQIASEKIYTVHSNELAEGYTLISVTIFIDKYGAGRGVYHERDSNDIIFSAKREGRCLCQNFVSKLNKLVNVWNSIFYMF